ncbi:MAG: hypothetical protein HN482_13990 [Bdellovibrionales bacterium]|jgi:hypothetical protein|nr:hypothetical protein [Bdellovibrionales bacterium]
MIVKKRFATLISLGCCILLLVTGCGGLESGLVGMAQGQKPIINVYRKPDALYDLINEIDTIKLEERHLERENYCYEKYTYNELKYNNCLWSQVPHRKVERYRKRDPLITLPEVQEQENKYVIIK